MKRDPGAAEPDDATELLELGGARAQWFARLWAARDRRTSRLRRALGWSVALGVGLAIGLALQPTAEHVATPAPKDVARVSMTAIRQLANQRGPLASYVRQASTAKGCALVAPGSSPGRAISAAIRSAFPGFTVKDTARTLDQFTGLCSIEVRATYRDAVLFVNVASPAAHPSRSTYTRVETGVETTDGITTKYAIALTRTGWTVLIGATGRSAILPGANDLVRTAQEPALIW
jgi:hypothetical protein